jgi:hypothetical protein
MGQSAETRALWERLGANEHRRSMTAERIFRELRKAEQSSGNPQIINALPKLSPTLR